MLAAPVLGDALVFHPDEAPNLVALDPSRGQVAQHSEGFATKRPVYANAFYTLTSHVAEASDWTPDTIEARQRTLAEFAVDTWPIKPKAKPTRPKAKRRGNPSDEEDFAEAAFRTRIQATGE